MLRQEELLWFQKSREEWITSGDRNTKHYHTLTIVKRNWNTCENLKDNDDRIITDKEEIKSLIRNHYNYLFSRDGACVIDVAPKRKKAIFYMPPLRHPDQTGSAQRSTIKCGQAWEN